MEFSDLYAACYGDVVAMAYALTGDFADAQDVAQEAFCRTWQRWRQVSGYDEPVAWVKRVAANLAISQARRRAVAKRFLLRQKEEHVPAVSADHVALVAVLRELPEKTRRAVVLHYLADLPVATVADILGTSQGTVKSWLHRGRAMLGSRLADSHIVREVNGNG